MKIEKQEQLVSYMIALYCKKKHKHKGGLCDECTQLQEYVNLRIEKCPLKDDKPFCSNCTIHCYKKDMREKIKSVMRFSGPRLIFSHPIMAIKHVIATIKAKKAKKSETEE